MRREGLSIARKACARTVDEKKSKLIERYAWLRLFASWCIEDVYHLLGELRSPLSCSRLLKPLLTGMAHKQMRSTLDHLQTNRLRKIHHSESVNQPQHILLLSACNKQSILNIRSYELRQQRMRLILRPLLTNQDKALVKNFRHAGQRFVARREVIATFPCDGWIVFQAMSDII